jgi:hypothetical protein
MTNDELGKENLDEYNIMNHLKCPRTIGTTKEVSEQGSYKTLDILTDNFGAFGIAYPFSGKQVFGNEKYGDVESNGFYSGKDYSLGSNFFVPLGKCGESSLNDCTGKDRYVYMRNIPTGKIPVMSNVSFQGFTGCNVSGVTEMRGLLPGLLEDISDIQPFALAEAYGENGNYGTNICKEMTFPVGTHIYDPKMECKGDTDCSADNKTWKYQTKCTPSYFNLKTATDGKERLFPSPPTLLGDVESFQEIPQTDLKIPILLAAVVATILIICLVARK